ncbi:FtsX-like permease family protein [Paenibacillus sp. NEAU-GSW1]|uniref:FtsX-like permease family protein n=1 Tax=Paenibacillus sp. NEAU-GSW1 TaxID=2682486 RepID=UPI0012E2EC42|nr:FtsX-like permease family protein [Paenibacillus sp. NEAU-GSW1]MUT65745.1 FtsX-like permease family protein [Paenibacillus sp. NEAU-GSW1]
MRTLWMLCWSGITKKKLQNGLIAVLILLSTVLLATSATVLANSGSRFADMHKQTNGSHQLLMLTKGLHDPKALAGWWKEQDGVMASELLPFRNIAGISYGGKELTNVYVMLMDTPAEPMKVDKLLFAEGESTAAPAPGTVWIPTSLARSHDISVGDRIEFKAESERFELTVSGVIVDLPYGAPFATTARIWLNHADYAERTQALIGGDSYLIGLRFENYGDQAAYWSSFEQHFGVPFLEGKDEFEEMSAFYLIMSRIIGFIMVFLGIVMLFIALFTIGYTISDAILSSYRTIGVFKSVGLRSNRIMSIYVLQYALLAFIAVVPGIAASKLLSAIIIKLSSTNLETPQSQMALTGSGFSLAAGLFIIVLVLLCVLVFAGKIRSVQPAQAIRYGMSEADNGKVAGKLANAGSGIVTFGRWPIAAVIALKYVAKNRKSSVLTAAMAALTTAVIVFGFVLLYSIMQIQQTAGLWGYDSSHIAVSVYNNDAFSSKDFQNAVSTDKRVKNFGRISDLNGVFPSEPGAADRSASQSMNISVSALDGSYEELGFETIKGKNPDNEHEIAIGVNVSRKLGKEVGDTLDVFLEGQKHTMTVSGIYQAIANMSYSARIKADAVRSESSGKDSVQMQDDDILFINLWDIHDADKTVSDLNAKYGKAIDAVTQKALLEAVYKEAVSILIVPMGFLMLLFTGVTFMIIYSLSRIAVWKEYRTYGIYKSLGMANRTIRGSITLGITVLSILGAVLGAIAGVYGLPNVLKSLLIEYGLVKLPIVVNGPAVALLAIVSIVATALAAWLSSRWLTKQSPRTLTIE